MLRSVMQTLKLQKTIGTLLLVMLVLSSSTAEAGRNSITIDPGVYNAISSVAGDPKSGLGLALVNISAQENGGSAKPTSHTNTNGTKDWGIMQINDVSLKQCGVTGEQLMTSDPMPSVRCALTIFKANSASCGTFEAKLCSYNKGGGWCRGYKSRAGVVYPPHPNEACDYSNLACTKTRSEERRVGKECA